MSLWISTSAFISIALLVAAAVSRCKQAQQKNAHADKPKYGDHAFINLDRAVKEQVADALKMLKRAQTIFESRGYQVQTIRSLHSRFRVHERIDDATSRGVLKEYDALAVKENSPRRLDRRC